MATYPSSVKSFTTKVNATDVVDASHMNAVQDEIMALEQDLLDGNVFVSRITTGLNASALSTGTLPDARLTGSYTHLTALTTSNATVTNVLTVNTVTLTGVVTANTANGSPGQVLTTNGTGVYWSTVTGGGGGGESANSSGGVGAVQYYTGTTFGASANLRFDGTTLNVNSATLNSTAYSGTANNATFAFGKNENHLNVNSATTAITANNSTYAFGKSENQLNVNSATHATNATNLNSQPGSYYTNASNLTTGTLPLAQLHGNVVLTTSTTGINASALSTGTVPDARLSGSYTNLTAVTIANTATTGRILEAFQTYNTAISGTPTITFNCTTGNLWNITNTISSNWTANFTNLGLTNNYATAVTLVVNQGAAAYLPNAVQIESNTATINWQAGTPPTPNPSKKDIFSFSVMQTASNTYLVLGQLVSFG